MNRGEIRTEVEARGYDYVPQTRLNLWIKQAYQYVCALEPWWFLESSVSGQAPLTITDLSQVLYVAYGDVSLRGADWRDIRDLDPGLDDTGTPVMWYLEAQAIKTWPTSTETLNVRYIREPPELTSDSSTPLIPEAYHHILVDLAVISGLKDNDEYEQAQGLQAVVDRSVSDMRDQEMVRNYQNPTQIVQTRHPDDYIA